MSYYDSDRRLARDAFEQMMTSLYANQDAKQQAAIAVWQAQEKEKAERIASQQMPQLSQQPLPSRLKKGWLPPTPRPKRSPVVFDGTALRDGPVAENSARAAE